MTFHKRWFKRAVWNDDGYEVAFVGSHAGVRKVRYSTADKSIVIFGEPTMVKEGNKLSRGLHFALDDRYITVWSDGSRTSVEERRTIRYRVLVSLKYMNISYTVDLPLD